MLVGHNMPCKAVPERIPPAADPITPPYAVQPLPSAAVIAVEKAPEGPVEYSCPFAYIIWETVLSTRQYAVVPPPLLTHCLKARH